MPRVGYVLINNPNYLGLPSLIEVSNHASTWFEDLYFIRVIVIYPRVEMHNLLKMLKFTSLVNKTERTMVLKELIGVAKEKGDVNYNKNDYYHLVLNLIMDSKIKILINGSKSNKVWKRSDSNKYNLMFKLLHQKRKNERQWKATY